MSRRRDVISEQELNIEFVKAVEKHPCLYNIELTAYSRKDLTDQAWEQVGNEMNMSASACRERWRNLRAVFMRAMKAPLRGVIKKRPYYLADVMQFVTPYLRPLLNLDPKERERIIAAMPRNKEPGEQKDEEVMVDVEQIKMERLEDSEFEIDSDYSLEETSVRKRSQPDLTKGFDETPNKKLKTVVIQNVQSLASPSNSVSGIETVDAVKSFVDSLMPELNEMNSIQFKSFKRKVLLLIDNIMTGND